VTELDESLLTVGSTSPFLPGTQIQFAFDSTSIGMLKTCPRLYYYTMIEGWAPKGNSIHLTFGIEYHHALEFYARLRATSTPHELAIRDTVREIHHRTADWVSDTSTKAGKYKNRETLVSLVVDYLDHFIDDPCETYIKSDGVPAVELSFRFELDFGPTDSTTPYILSGHLDRVVRFNDYLFVMDHKTTTTTLGDYYFNQYAPDNQMTLYTIAGGIVLHAPIRGVIIRAAQILLEKPHRFVSGFTYRTPDEIEEWLFDLRLWLNQAEIYAIENYWPMNDKSCGMYGGCKFREICSKSPHVRERFLAADYIKLAPENRWNPIKSRGE
jgi:hypothetical protein